MLGLGRGATSQHCLELKYYDSYLLQVVEEARENQNNARILQCILNPQEQEPEATDKVNVLVFIFNLHHSSNAYNICFTPSLAKNTVLAEVLLRSTSK